MTTAAGTGALVHRALLFDGVDAFADTVAPFVGDALAAGAPVMAAVPGDRLAALRRAAGSAADRVTLVDMADLGRNPARIIPAVRRFVDDRCLGGSRALFVGEPIWPGRSPAEVGEAIRHEALLNLAFASTPITILCPYDATALDEPVLHAMARTHAELVEDGERRRSAAYAEPAALLGDHDLPPPPDDAATLVFHHGGLARLRRFVAERARRAGAGDDGVDRLLVAVNEVATNTLTYTDRPGTLRIWCDGDTVVCEVRDNGHVADPLAGRTRPSAGPEGGRGLWIVNQTCDLVQLRSGPAGTAVRLHVERCRRQLPQALHSR